MKSILPVVGVIAFIVIVIVGIVGVANIDPSSQVTGPIVALQSDYPEPTNYVVDTTGSLSASQLSDLQTLLKNADNGKHQFGVAIIPTTGSETIEQYGIHLAEKWKVGDSSTDNGAIIIIATKDRKVRIEVGYGLEGSITDSVAGRIIDENMTPSLKKGDWYSAVVAGINRLSELAN